MGADFTWAMCPEVNLTADRKERIKACIATLPVEAFEDIVDNDDEIDILHERLFDDVMLACVDCTRETSTINMGDWRGVITGGMSWGDGPTEAYGPISRIGNFPDLWELLVSFSKEDSLAFRAQ